MLDEADKNLAHVAYWQFKKNAEETATYAGQPAIKGFYDASG